MQESAITVWQDISGTGMLTGVFLCAVIYLLYREDIRYKRIVFVYLPLFWTIVLMLPMTYHVISEIVNQELYYRFFWLLPMTATICYSMVKIYHSCKPRYQQMVLVIMIGTIVLSGDFVYNNWRYKKAETIYHIPSEVVEICDDIHPEGREVIALFPIDLMQYVRQYDAAIGLPFGRDVLVEGWLANHPLYELLCEEELDLDMIGEEARNADCSYIILEKEEITQGRLETYGYKPIKEMGEYIIYFCEEEYISIYN